MFNDDKIRMKKHFREETNIQWTGDEKSGKTIIICKGETGHGKVRVGGKRYGHWEVN